MKKIVTLGMAVLMLAGIFTGCKKAEEEQVPIAPEIVVDEALVAEPTPQPTVEPTPEVQRPKDEPAELAKAYCEKMGYPYDATFERIFAQAISTLPTDYSEVNDALPMQLYLLPYNIGISLGDGKESLFMTNAELTEQLGAQKVADIAAQAVQWEKTSGTVLPHKDEAYYLAEYALCNVSESEAAEYAAFLMDCAEENDMTQYRFFITDPSLVYRAANGDVCVKGRFFYMVEKANKAYFKNFPEEGAGQWYYGDAEVRMRETANGFTPTITYKLSPVVPVDEDNKVYLAQFEAAQKEAHKADEDTQDKD